MYTLGINAVFHDSSACLIHDGKLVAAAEEERFTHIKHGKRPIPFSTYELPFHAIDFCLSQASLHLNDVDHIAYSFNPYTLISKWKWELVSTNYGIYSQFISKIEEVKLIGLTKNFLNTTR